MAIHKVYDEINLHERLVVDEALRAFCFIGRTERVSIANDDRIERVAEAMAICIRESRPPAEKPKTALEERHQKEWAAMRERHATEMKTFERTGVDPIADTDGYKVPSPAVSAEIDRLADFLRND